MNYLALLDASSKAQNAVQTVKSMKNQSAFSDELSAANALVDVATLGVNAITDPSKYKAGSTGAAVGGAALGAVGSIFGPVGTVVGATVGKTIGGAIGGAMDNKAQMRDLNEIRADRFAEFNPFYDGNKRGQMGAPVAEEGMLAMPTEDMSLQSPTGQNLQLQPEVMTVNVEKGEILVDPESLAVLQEFDNPNRFMKHNKDRNPFKENSGNFVDIPVNSMVIPAKLAKMYKEGNSVTKRSILKNILKEQKNNPAMNAPMGMAPVAEDGMAAIRRRQLAGPANNFVDQVLANDPVMGFTDHAVQPVLTPETIQALDAMGVPGTGESRLVPTPAKASQPGYIDAMGAMFKPQAGTPNPNVDDPGSGAERNVGLIGAQVLNFLPTVVGFANAQRRDPFLAYNDMGDSFNRAEAILQTTQTKPSTQAAEAAVARSVNPLVDIMRQYGSPSVRAEMARAQTQAIDRVGAIQENAVNVEQAAQNQLISSLADLELRRGADALGATRLYQEELRQDQAARENLSMQYLSEGVTNNAMMQMDQERIRALNEMSKIFDANPYMKKLLQDDPNAIKNILDIMNLPAPVDTKTTTVDTDRTQTRRNRWGVPIGTTNTRGTTKIKRNG